MIEVLTRLKILDPLTADEAANKRYVDTVATGGVPALDADQINLGANITVTQAVGGLRYGETIADTDNLWEILRRMLNPVTPPTYVQPTLSLSAAPAVAQEIGSNITAILTPTFNPGSSGGITQYRLARDGTTIFTNPTAAAHTDTAFQLVTAVTYQAQADYAQGPIFDDSDNNPYPNGQIQPGTATAAQTYTPQRRAFYGTIAAAPTTSAQVRALANQPLNPAAGSVLTVDGIGANGVCFAVPQPRTVQITMPLAMNMNVTPAPTTVSVDGATAGQNAAAYNVYFVPQASAPSTATPYEARIS